MLLCDKRASEREYYLWNFYGPSSYLTAATNIRPPRRPSFPSQSLKSSSNGSKTAKQTNRRLSYTDQLVAVPAPAELTADRLPLGLISLRVSAVTRNEFTAMVNRLMAVIKPGKTRVGRPPVSMDGGSKDDVPLDCCLQAHGVPTLNHLHAQDAIIGYYAEDSGAPHHPHPVALPVAYECLINLHNHTKFPLIGCPVAGHASRRLGNAGRRRTRSPGCLGPRVPPYLGWST